MSAALNARLVPELQKLPAKEWNKLAGDEVFLSHEFLSALEESKAVCPRTGWQPCHLVLEEENNIVAAMPLYLKGHSQGEYIFDHGWADALEQTGEDYYPKLVSCIPFTPVTGARLLGDTKYHPALLNAAQQTMKKMDASSLHINFLPQQESHWSKEQGMLERTHYQFHWHNQGYDSFEDFLNTLSSRHRKNIKKERRRAQETLVIKPFSGADLNETLWDKFFDFYMDTGMRKWGHPYLTRETFSLLGERLAERILLLMAYRDDQPIAGALNFMDKDKLYGRYWGALKYHPYLHFELSYYQAIDFAIERKMKTVEAGAQGEHKLERGYVPTKTYSTHLIAHEGLSRAVANFLDRENHAVDSSMDYLDQTTPFKKKTL